MIINIREFNAIIKNNNYLLSVTDISLEHI